MCQKSLRQQALFNITLEYSFAVPFSSSQESPTGTNNQIQVIIDFLSENTDILFEF